MSPRLRPGLHYAPVRDGVIFMSPRHSFVLVGPESLIALVDRVVPMLEDGSDPPAMAAALGRESLLPVLERVVASLDGHGLLLHETALRAPAPSPEERRKFAGAIAHLETFADDPAEALSRLRDACVVVRGAGPEAARAEETLLGCAVGAVRLLDPEDGDGGLDLELDGGVSVPVRTAGGMIVTGPVLDGEPARARHAALLARVESWSRREPTEGACRPLGPMLAAAHAAHAAFEHLALGPRPVRAHVVHSALECDELALEGRVAPTAPSEPVDPDSGRAEIEPAAAAVRESEPLLARWTGLARWQIPGELAQIPVSIAVLAGREARIPALLHGWGQSQAQASLDALLALLRAGSVGGAEGAEEVGVAAAGIDARAGRLDGALRLLRAELGAPEPFDETLLDLEGRRRWRALTEGESTEASVTVAGLPGSELVLAEVSDGGGDSPLASHWGLALPSAAADALGAALAARRVAVAAGGESTGGGPTSALLVAPPESLDPLERAIARVLGGDRELRSTSHPPDPVLGPLPLWAGLVWWR